MPVAACSGIELTLIDHVHVGNRGVINVVEHSSVTEETA
jgi:hypothetical protein